MATAFLPLANVFDALQQLAAWFAPRPAPVPCMPAPRMAARPAGKPLRVVRVVEAAAPRAIAGRMVISGRMADVCAELERLAALEARAN